MTQRPLRSWVHESEDVVEDIVASLVRQQLECLRVAHWPLFLLDLNGIKLVNLCKSLKLLRVGGGRGAKRGSKAYQECAGDHDEDGAAVVGGLCVDCAYLVADLAEGEVLL